MPGSYSLKVISGQATPKKLDLTGKNSVKVGKNSSCDIVISGFLMGKTQFFLTRKVNSLFLIPLGSFRNTYLNDKKVEHEIKINLGDTIKTGNVTFKFGP
jgi:pSer/pThr/pTyr-binding forkhead associated (FHA) protein